LSYDVKASRSGMAEQYTHPKDTTMSEAINGATFQQAHETCERIIANIEKVIIGKRSVIEETLVALLDSGHLLLEDVPGVGKTMLAKSLAYTIGGEFARIQFTPDLMPSDVTGVSIYNQRSGSFSFRKGPVFANVVLADEINRANPRTQSALLEAMEERQVTVDGETHALPHPFVVVATENPIEYEGVYPLPESQLDRFMLKLSIGYPSEADEKTVVKSQLTRHPIDDLEPVCDASDVEMLQATTARCHVDEAIYDYVMAIVSRTRDAEQLELGASPRGTLAAIRTAQALAIIEGRDFVTPDDIKRLAVNILAHRTLLASHARLGEIGAADIVGAILEEVPVPV